MTTELSQVVVRVNQPSFLLNSARSSMSTARDSPMLVVY